VLGLLELLLPCCARYTAGSEAEGNFETVVRSGVKIRAKGRGDAFQRGSENTGWRLGGCTRKGVT
jgi:hypothetical protein